MNRAEAACHCATLHHPGPRSSLQLAILALHLLGCTLLSWRVRDQPNRPPKAWARPSSTNATNKKCLFCPSCIRHGHHFNQSTKPCNQTWLFPVQKNSQQPRPWVCCCCNVVDGSFSWSGCRAETLTSSGGRPPCSFADRMSRRLLAAGRQSM